MTAIAPRAPACPRHECNAEAAGPVADRDGRTHAGTSEGIQRATRDGETMLAGPGPLPGNKPATWSAPRAGSPRLRLAQDRGEDCALFHSLVRSGMPIPGCVVRRFLRRQSYAQLAWFVNRVQWSGEGAHSQHSHDRNRSHTDDAMQVPSRSLGTVLIDGPARPLPR